MGWDEVGVIFISQMLVRVAQAGNGFNRLCFGIGRLQVMKRCKGYAKVICWAALRSYLETLQLSKVVGTTSWSSRSWNGNSAIFHSTVTLLRSKLSVDSNAKATFGARVLVLSSWSQQKVLKRDAACESPRRVLGWDRAGGSQIVWLENMSSQLAGVQSTDRSLQFSMSALEFQRETAETLKSAWKHWSCQWVPLCWSHDILWITS